MTKKYLGYSIVILLLCRKAGVPKFTDGCVVNLTRPLDAGWIVEHPMMTTPAAEALEIEEHPEEPTGPSRTQSQYVSEGVSLAYEESQGHRDECPCFDLCRIFMHILDF